jgi:hypothetical protein
MRCELGRLVSGGWCPYHHRMALAVIWHYWIGVVLTIAAIALVLPIVAGYLYKVVRPKYPPRQR